MLPVILFYLLFIFAQAMASAFVQPQASWVTRAAPVSAMPEMDFAASSMFEATSSFAESSTAVRRYLDHYFSHVIENCIVSTLI